MEQYQITISGANFAEIAARAEALANELKGDVATTTTPKVTKKTKAAPAPVQEEMLMDDTTDEVGTDESVDDFMGDVTPKVTKTKVKKLTDKDVNAAAIAHAKQNGRAKTLAILKKKFKVESILELKPDQYASVIEALEV